MRKQDYLVQLIHSLSTSEKRYFKLYNSPQKGSKKYELLFDEILLAETYDAKALCKKLKINSAQLGHEKAYLQEVLFKAMRNFHDNQPYVAMMNQLVDAHLLTQKTMMAWAYEILTKTAENARATSRYEIAYKAYELQITAGDSQRRNAKLGYSDVFAKAQKMDECVKSMQLTNEFSKLLAHIFTIMSAKPEVENADDIKKVKKLINDPLLQQTYDDPQFTFHKHSALSYLYNLIMDEEAFLQQQILLFELIETKAEAVGVDGDAFVMQFSNLAIAYNEAHRLQSVKDLIRKMKTRYYHKFLPNGKELDPILDANAYRIMTIAYNTALLGDEVDYTEVKQFIVSYEKVYKNVIKYMRANELVTHLVTLSRCCFWINDYDTAMRWVLEIQNNYSPDIQSGVQGTAKIWFAIMHAERKNYKLLVSLVRNTEMHLKKYNTADEADRTTLRFLKKIHKLKGEAETKAAFKALLKEYEKLEQGQLIKVKLEAYKKWANQRLSR